MDSLTQALHVLCAQPFRGSFDFEFYLFAVSQTFFPAKAFYIVPVNKDVFATVVRFDESEAFFGVKPFYFSAWHNSFDSSRLAYNPPKKLTGDRAGTNFP
jgi:hypothetical protein